MKALIIDEPWITEVLRGRKIWEMRKTACHHRGQIALVRKGSGQLVGVADVIDSLPAIETPEAYAAAEDRHRIPPERQKAAFADGWRRPWVLTNSRVLAAPVPYQHPMGAVIWVNLHPQEAAAVSAQLGREEPRPDVSTEAVEVHPLVTALRSGPEKSAKDSASLSLPPVGTVRDVRLTGGNLRHNHIYLPLDFFPTDAIGGSNKSQLAPKTLSVTFRPGVTVETDIDRSKKILRIRSAVREFLAAGDFEEGDTVRICCTGPYTYEFVKGSDA